MKKRPRKKPKHVPPLRVLLNEVGRLLHIVVEFFAWPVKAFAHTFKAFFPKSSMMRHHEAHLVLYAIGGVAVIIAAVVATPFVEHHKLGVAVVEVAKASGACPLWEVVQRLMGAVKNTVAAEA